MKRVKKYLFAIALCVVLIGCGVSATTMRIVSFAGDVLLSHDEKAKELKEELRLVSGDVIKTGADGLATVALDDYKMVTMEHNSKTSFTQEGKKLSLNVEEGAIFFNVDKPLEEDESFDISTSTMVVGIRGTSGYVNTDDNGHESLTLTDGKVTVTCKNPVSGKTKEVTVNSGEKLTVIIDGDNIDYTIEPFYSGGLPETTDDAPEASEEEPEDKEFVLEGSVRDAITSLFASDDKDSLLALAMTDNLEGLVKGEVQPYNIEEDMQYINGEYLTSRMYFYGEDAEFAREGDSYVIFLDCDNLNENSRIFITLKGKFNSGSGGIGYSYEAGYVSTDYSDKYIAVNPYTGEMVEYYDASNSSDALNKKIPGDFFN